MAGERTGGDPDEREEDIDLEPGKPPVRSDQLPEEGPPEQVPDDTGRTQQP